MSIEQPYAFVSAYEPNSAFYEARGAEGQHMSVADTIERALLQRVNVVGSSGSGKSTFARRLARRLDIPYVEMDAIFWEPNWTQPSDEVFFARLARALAGERWVLDGNYDRTSHLKWQRAQTVIWLDYSLRRKLFQVVKRTLTRLITREALWPGTGNRESLRMLLSRDSIVLFAYRTHDSQRRRYEAMIANPPKPGLRFVRLRTPRDAERFLKLARA